MKTTQHFSIFVLLLVAGHFALATPQALTVTASDATGYQWYYNTDSSTNGATLISGATQPSYTPDQNSGGPYFYFCVVTNDCGTAVMKDTSHISGMHTMSVPVSVPISEVGSPVNNEGTCNTSTSISGRITYGDTLNGDINRDTTRVGTQVWSAPVFVSGCNKPGFAGGSNPYNSDCRKNTDDAVARKHTSGGSDLFSWCAVVRYAASLCPSPWRVPTNTDFCTLDNALGGPSPCPASGTNHSTSGVAAKYYNTGSGFWGGSLGGYCNSDGTLDPQGSLGIYWSSVQNDATSGYNLRFTSSGSINPQSYSTKYYGFALRCVRG